MKLVRRAILAIALEGLLSVSQATAEVWTPDEVIDPREAVLKLGAVAPGSLLAEADFREGDLVAALDGVPATDATLEQIVRALTEGRESVGLRIYRGGVPLDRTFTPTR